MSELSTEELLNRIGQPAEQPRDEQGRFASAEGEKETEPEVLETEQPVEEEAEAQDDLRQQVNDLKELVTALNAQLQQKTSAPKREVRKLTAEDEFRLSQDLSMTPTKAMREWFESEMGMTIEDFREHQTAALEAVQATRAVEAGNRFISNHPEYVNNPANAQRIANYLAHLGLDPSDPASYEKAYKDLTASKLIETTAPAPKTTTKKTIPGIKSRGGSGPTTQTNSIEEEERKMREMPVDQMLAYMNRQMNQR